MTIITTNGAHPDDDLAQRARLVVLSSGMSQREFAQTIGMDPTALSKALAGVRRLSDREIASIAALGKVSQRYLRTGVGRPPSLSPPVDVDQILRRSTPVDATLRRTQILDSTARLIARRGLHHVRVADIARACNTSTGTIHNYFPTKEDALRAALDHYADHLIQRLQGEFALAIDNVDKLRRLVEVQLIITEQDADEWSIWVQSWNEAILRSGFREFHQRMYERWRQTVLETIRACQRDGIGTSGDAETLTNRFTGMVDGLAIQMLSGSPAMSTPAMRDLLLDAFEPHICLRLSPNA
jgi:AcrR family transcriptional regulator